MLKLNLVSQELKNEIKLRHIYEMLKKANYILIAVTFFVAIVILTAKIIMQNNFNEIVEQTTLITKSSQARNTRVKEVIAKIDYIDKVQNDFIAWSFLFEDIAENVNDDVSFNFIEVNKERNEAIFKGIAKTRDGLLNLKKGLESSKVFINIDFPIQNILEKENINFEIKAGLDLSEYK
ncbi:MAG: hypothetical protein ABIE43_00465 [Patescibacteria group bacterium]